MKRLITLFAIVPVLLTGCRLENGMTSGHTSSALEAYAYRMFNANVIRPAAEINMLIELDRYISATLEEQQSDEFEWHRQNFFHEDDVTFNAKSLGTIYTYGKSFFDEGSAWKTNLIYERVGENSWKVSPGPYDQENINTIVTFEGRNPEGKNVFLVDAQSEDDCYTSYPNGDHITATLSNPEGPIMVKDPEILTDYDIKRSNIPQGSGVFKIETKRNGKLLDQIELRYTPLGDSMTFTVE